jgi:hypothetical protein
MFFHLAIGYIIIIYIAQKLSKIVLAGEGKDKFG